LTKRLFKNIVQHEAAIVIYEHIINANKRFGTDPVDIVHFVFQCEPEMIQSNVIIAPLWNPELFSDCSDSTIQNLNGIVKIWTLSIAGRNITYIITGMGSPNVNDIVLALGCTPCKKIIFIGSVGALDVNIKIGDIVIPEYSVGGDGTCRYLTSKKIADNDSFGEKNYPNKELFDKIVSKAKETTGKNGVNYHIGKNFSTDTIIAQFAHIDEIINMGCNCIEMETSVLFKSAEICSINAGAVFCVSDNSILRKSLLSGITKEEMDYEKNVRKNILTKIVIDSFL
jgi:purine-nucleoside phosphorylase